MQEFQCYLTDEADHVVRCRDIQAGGLAVAIALGFAALHEHSATAPVPVFAIEGWSDGCQLYPDGTV